MQDLDPSDICKKKFLNPLKRIRVIIRTPTHRRTDGRTDGQTDGRTGWIQYTPLNFVSGGFVSGGIIKRLLPIHTGNVLLKFVVGNQSQTIFRLQKPKNPIWLPGSHFESDITEKSICFYPNTKVMCYLSLDLIFKARVLEPKRSNMATKQPFWKWCCWKSTVFCLWLQAIYTWTLKLKFQRKLDLGSWSHVTYKQTDWQMDRQTRWIQYTLPSFIGRGYKMFSKIHNVIWHL